MEAIEQKYRQLEEEEEREAQAIACSLKVMGLLATPHHEDDWLSVMAKSESDSEGRGLESTIVLFSGFR